MKESWEEVCNGNPDRKVFVEVTAMDAYNLAVITGIISSMPNMPADMTESAIRLKISATQSLEKPN